MKTVSSLLAASLLISTASVQAAPTIQWKEISFAQHTQHLDAGYTLTLKGFGISGSALLTDKVLLTASKSRTSGQKEGWYFPEVNLSTTTVGLGLRNALTESTDYFGIMTYEQWDAGQRDNGLGVTAGVRSMLNDYVELSGAIRHLNVGDDGSETGASVGARFYLNATTSMNLGYEKYDDFSDATFSLSFYF